MIKNEFCLEFNGTVQVLDSSRKAFINENCYKDEVIARYVLKQLEQIGFSKNNIVQGLDLNIAIEGDYRIGCVGGDILVSQIEMIGNSITLRPIGFL